ncbi:hypothetical protein JCM5350_000512 [Sporobolomyces pararoseus]
MSDSKNVDYLSRLPSELVQTILAQLDDRDRALLHPISRTLVPFQQLRLYRIVFLESYAQLAKFCKTRRGSSFLMKHVRQLEISITPNLDASAVHSDSNPISEQNDPFVPSTKEVEQLFGSLENVKVLVLHGSTRLASLVLCHDVASSSFPQLSDLKISSTLTDFDDPFHPDHYQHLGEYASLDTFALHALRYPRGVQPSNDGSIETKPVLDSIWDLSLAGPLSAYPTSVESLLPSSDRLVLLSLDDNLASSRLYEFVRSVQHPETIRYLELEHSDFQGTSPEGSIVDVLEKFSSLLHLAVGGNCTLSPDFYSSLRTLPLESLTFKIFADVNLDELSRLISGPRKHKSLTEISFDNVEATMGTTIEEMGGEPFERPDGSGWDLYPGWQLPDWSDSFNREDLGKFIVAAGKEGIKVNGNVFQAMAIEDRYDEEVERLECWEYVMEDLL